MNIYRWLSMCSTTDISLNSNVIAGLLFLVPPLRRNPQSVFKKLLMKYGFPIRSAHGNDAVGLPNLYLIVSQCLFALLLLSGTRVQAQKITVPDANFRTALDSAFAGTTVSGNTVTFTTPSAGSITTLDLSHKNIGDLSGIEAFTGLTTLNVSDNRLKRLNLQAATGLRELYCSSNALTTLDVKANTALTALYCSFNQLTSLDVGSNTALRELSCENNALKLLDVRKDTLLTTLYCSVNQLTTLDVASNKLLTTLFCASNQLTSLDVTANPLLARLNCHYNKLNYLDLSANPALAMLVCSYNKFGGLNVGANPALTHLNCGLNSIMALDVSTNPALTMLDCNNNQLTTLNVALNPALTQLVCSSNKLTQLDLHANPALVKLFCSSNQLMSLDVHANEALSELACANNPMAFILTDSTVALINKDELTQVGHFRSASAAPNVGAGQTGAFVLDTTGATVVLLQNTDGESSLAVSCAANPTVNGKLPSGTKRVLPNKYWTMRGPATARYNLILNLSDFAAGSKFETLKVLKRADASDSWHDVSRLPMGASVHYLKPFVIVTGLTAFSEFAIGASK
jgi:Leucine-rich repeat (LRR) protein